MRTPPAESRPFVRFPRRLAPLGYRNYALYWVGLLTSHTGRWIEQTGCIWLLYQLTQSPVSLAALGIVTAVPTLLIQPFAGVVADRVDQRKFLFMTQGLALLASLTLGLIVAFGHVEPWQIYLEVGFVATVAAFDVSVRQAFFARLVPREHLADAVTLNSTAGRSSALLGPAIGGVTIAAFGVAAPYLLNAATFLALMAAVVLMREVKPRKPTVRDSFRGELAEGLRYLRAAPVLSGLLKLEVMFGVFQVNPVIIAIIGRQVFNVGPEGLGGLLAAPALGSLIGIGFLLTIGQPLRGGRFVVLCQFAYAAALIGFAVSRSFPVSVALLALVGFLDVLTTVVRMSIMQLAAPGRMRGRLMANMRTVTGGVGPLAQTQSGLMANAIGGPLSLIIAGFALMAAAGLVARTNPALWRFSHGDMIDEPAGLPVSGSALPVGPTIDVGASKERAAGTLPPSA